MSEITVSQVTSTVNENSLIHVEFITENTPAVRSDILAEHFNRSHKNVLRDIAKLRANCPESFYGLNFEPVTYIDFKGEKRPAYLLTRDAFSLLVMGFTGKAAIQWKLRYIEAFNALELAVRENVSELAREAGYAQGLDEGRALMLPTLESTCQEAFERGLKEGKSQKYDRLLKVRRALVYMDKGLKLHEAAKLVNMNRQTLSESLGALGLHTPKTRRPRTKKSAV